MLSMPWLLDPAQIIVSKSTLHGPLCPGSHVNLHNVTVNSSLAYIYMDTTALPQQMPSYSST
jgi:hypothetical protein